MRLHRTIRALLIALVASVALATGPAAARPTLTLLPVGVEVRSRFSSDGLLEILDPADLSDEGVVVGQAFDLQRDYGYAVGWIWSRETGLRAVDPTNGDTPWVADGRNRKRLRSACEVASGSSAYCVDDIGKVLYRYSRAGGFEILDRGDPAALETIAAAFSDEARENLASIPIHWNAANARGNGGVLALTPNVLSEGRRNPVGLIHSPELGWQVLTDLDPRLEGGDVINDPKVFNERGDALLNHAPSGVWQQVYLLERDGRLVPLSAGEGLATSLCHNLTNARRTCGIYFAGDGATHPSERVYRTFLYEPGRGVVEIEVGGGLLALLVLPDGELLMSRDSSQAPALEWFRYSPELDRLTPLITERSYRRFFPRGTRDLARRGTEIGPAGDLVFNVAGRFKGREIVRPLFYSIASGKLAPVADMVRDSRWIDYGSPKGKRGTRQKVDIELIDFRGLNAQGETLWLAIVSGRPRAVVLSP